MPSLNYDVPPERLKCPEYYQERIEIAGGLNRYGQPNYKIAWAQTEITRQGGEWEAEGDTFVGYRDVLLSDGHPHWILLKWIDAGKSVGMPFLNPEHCISWYRDNSCPKTGLSLLGEYPYHGSYQVVLDLAAKYTVKGNFCIEAFPLSHEIIDLMIPIIKHSPEVSVKDKMKLMDQEKEENEINKGKRIEEIYQDGKVPDAITPEYHKYLQDKQREIEKNFNKALCEKLLRNKGFRQGRPTD